MLVSIEGIAQAGKSTVIQAVLSAFPNKFVLVDTSCPAIVKENYREDYMSYLLRCAAKRADKQKEICELLAQGKHVIVESYCSWFRAAFTLVGSPELYRALDATTRVPDLMIHLQADVTETHRRAGRSFDQGFEHRMLSIYNRYKWDTIPSGDKETTTRKTINIILKELDREDQTRFWPLRDIAKSNPLSHYD